MTREEFLHKYGDVEVVLSGYCRGTLYFRAELPHGRRMLLGCDPESGEPLWGGVRVGEPVKVKRLAIRWGHVSGGVEVVDSLCLDADFLE